MISTKSRFKLLDEGIYELTVSRRPKLETGDNYDYYTFDFEAVDKHGRKQDFREFFFPNEDRLRDVLKALGGIENDEGEVEIDEDEIVGMTFNARISHQVIKGKTRAKIEKVIRETQKEGPKDDEEPPF